MCLFRFTFTKKKKNNVKVLKAKMWREITEHQQLTAFDLAKPILFTLHSIHIYI